MYNFKINQFVIFCIVLILFGCRSKKINVKKNNTSSVEKIAVEIKKNDDLVIDSDGDGVVNKFDLEPSTPIGNTVDESGRSLDLDDDGVPDYIDDDPFSTLGAVVGENGRELDSDGDGVPNNRDLEPSTKKGSCVNNRGELINCKAAVFPSIYFQPNSSEVRDFNLDRLQVITSILRNNLSYKLRIIGFFDFDGLESYNVELDLKRAKAVSQKLSNIFGIDSDRMVIESNLQKDKNKKGLLRKVEFELF